MGTDRAQREHDALLKHVHALAMDKIHALARAGLDADALMERAAEALRKAFPRDFMFLGTVDPDTYAIDRFYRQQQHPAFLSRIIENEYMEDDFNKMVQLARAPFPVGILSQSTRGEPERSVRYRELYRRKLGMEHEMRAVLRLGRKLIGFLTLQRPAGSPDYTPMEAKFLSSFLSVLEQGLRAAMAKRLSADRAAADLGGTGLVVFNDDFRAEAANAIGEMWLRDMGERLDGFVTGIGTMAKLGNAGDPLGAPLTPRVRTYMSGRWLTIDASRLTGPNGQTKVSLLIEGARPAHLHSLLYEAYGFTERERELVQAILRGSSTRLIARELRISEYTVQDYLKSIFDKTGVRSRRDLVGKLLLDRS